MPFHIEIGSPVNFARVFNVNEEVLRTAVLEPWVAGLPLEFGEQIWEPRESRLTILEGPELPPTPAAADDDGWAAALRAAEDVTRPMLEAAEASAPRRTAVVVKADSVESALREIRGGQIPQQIPWASAVERIEGNGAEITAVILVVKRTGAAWAHL